MPACLTGCSRERRAVSSVPTEVPGPAPVRVAVIGGMTMTGLWDYMASEFTRRTGIPVEVAVTGPKEVLDEAFRGGGIDLLTMHSSDTATRLVVDGLACNLRPWACNELVLVGPADDPAGVRGLSDGAAALARIAERQMPFVEARNSGSQMVSNALWKLAGINPVGGWVLKDESPARQLVVEFARSRGAYVIVGRIPVMQGKIPAAGMAVMVAGDPHMRRPYVVVEAVSAMVRSRNAGGARLLADFLTSRDGQQRLAEHASRQNDRQPMFFPGSPEGG